MSEPDDQKPIFIVCYNCIIEQLIIVFTVLIVYSCVGLCHKQLFFVHFACFLVQTIALDSLINPPGYCVRHGCVGRSFVLCRGSGNG